MAAKSLECRECGAEYELEATYVCERCFGPLEVSYERPETVDVDGLRRRIQAGPQNIWRYADFLPLAAPPGPSARLTSRAGLPAGCTPLVRADRLAARLGLREVWVKNDSANPTHSFKDRVVTVAAARAPHFGRREAAAFGQPSGSQCRQHDDVVPDGYAEGKLQVRMDGRGGGEGVEVAVMDPQRALAGQSLVEQAGRVPRPAPGIGMREDSLQGSRIGLLGSHQQLPGSFGRSERAGQPVVGCGCLDESEQQEQPAAAIRAA